MSKFEVPAQGLHNHSLVAVVPAAQQHGPQPVQQVAAALDKHHPAAQKLVMKKIPRAHRKKCVEMKLFTYKKNRHYSSSPGTE